VFNQLARSACTASYARVEVIFFELIVRDDVQILARLGTWEVGVKDLFIIGIQ
jgi:hypothetical protein